MKALIRNVINFFRKVNNTSKAKNHEIENALLRSEKKSDIKRWQKNSELYQDWDERTEILGSFILPNSNIIEFGAGNMFLKRHLNNYKTYTATDIVKRFEETIVYDLNNNATLDLSNYNVAVFSGVLEYVYDIDSIFSNLKKNCKQVVLSYCCSDLMSASRDKNGWLSDYTKEDLEEIFTKYGYKVNNYCEWKKQSIFNLLKQD